ncbi:Galactose/lactose metabolism regulatory protein-like protein [Rhypophila decipiens]|uniref:Galactose/lactose metabolism regulatory protein-like protein n=1 Tax=Rhypophila decipiens TaxID=261697 RepID=A0AAN7B529_9PEZI|nr:Galactose/lactose metabolism regulatory protein-like protein [Rhypophila decipiens]
MAPVRVALIGLSASAKTSWASGAHLPYLLSSRGQSKYQITALLNSSVEAAEASRATYNLSDKVRLYGDPAALAQDAEVDLVVCNTRVDKHFETIYPSVLAGKAVYSEWPLAANAEEAKKLVEAAKQNGGIEKTMVGVQGRLAPISLKVKEIIGSGKIGKVLSSELKFYGGSDNRDTLPEGLSYFYDRKVGGNIYTIGFAHSFDLVQSVLGEAVSLKGHFQLQRPEGKVFSPVTKEALPSVQSDVPDLIITTATLPESPTVQKNATLLVNFRRGQSFPGEPIFVWTINGEKGEIRIVSQDSWAVWVLPGNPKKPTIEVHDFASGTVEELGWEYPDWHEELPTPARNVASLYEAFADGKGYPTFEDALKRHEQLEEMIKDWTP